VDPTVLRVLGLLGGLGVFAWLIVSAANRRGTKTILAIRNKVYFVKNGDADWRDLLGRFDEVSVKIADGGSWQSFVNDYAAPLVEAIRAAGSTPTAWHYLYFTPWRTNGYETEWKPYKSRKYGMIEARYRKFRRFKDTAADSGHHEALAALRGMQQLGIKTIMLNAEYAGFGGINAVTVVKGERYKVTDWPNEGLDINAAVQAYADTIKAEIPDAVLIWNGLSTSKLTPATIAKLDGWLPMRYQTSSGAIARGWDSAYEKRFPGLAWGVMTGAKASYFPNAYFEEVAEKKPDMAAFFYGPGSRLGPTVEAAAAIDGISAERAGETTV
jgi:hypothetical protein